MFSSHDISRYISLSQLINWFHSLYYISLWSDFIKVGLWTQCTVFFFLSEVTLLNIGPLYAVKRRNSVTEHLSHGWLFTSGENKSIAWQLQIKYTNYCSHMTWVARIFILRQLLSWLMYVVKLQRTFLKSSTAKYQLPVYQFRLVTKMKLHPSGHPI